MPSLRKRVSSYFRQLSFYNEPRERRHNINDNAFVTKYLEGHIGVKEGPPILYGKNPTDLPNYDLGAYSTGPDSVVGCYSGPNGGLTTVKRLEKHLSIPDTDIDFIDTQDEPEVPVSPEKSPQKSNQSVDNTTMMIKVAGQVYLVTNQKKKQEGKSQSLGSLSDIEVEIDKTKICPNNNNNEVQCKNQELAQTSAAQNGAPAGPPSQVSNKPRAASSKRTEASGQRKKSDSYGLSKSKSEGNPFQHKKRGKIIKISSRPSAHGDAASTDSDGPQTTIDPALPEEWNRRSDHIFGISDSLYDRNQVTKSKNGDPIADCFGVVARSDSAILAVADGVNWGEKASVAAKSAIHGCLHYLNKTIFNDTKPFDELSRAEGGPRAAAIPQSRVANTREVFVCLLRAFNCAHDLILENEGMLTTLTVAVVLPLKTKHAKAKRDSLRQDRGPRRPTPERQGVRTRPAARDEEDTFVCCVCNVGDTLAYVYSQKYGVRELTKGSHDINCNRDMRDALGALGPVDGVNPELSNLTLSLTTVHKGDVILVASDGLTDNFDPNVCKFTVNHKDSRPKRPSNKENAGAPSHKEDDAKKSREEAQSTEDERKVPVKPPRRHKERSEERRSESSHARAASASDADLDNPLVAQFLRENSLEEAGKRSSLESQPRRAPSSQPKPVHVHKTASRSIPLNRALEEKQKAQKTGFLRSKTTLDMRAGQRAVLRNEDGVPYVTPLQRYEISLLLMEDVLKHGISGHEFPSTTARKVCENLVNFTFSISSAKRHTLEDVDLYFDNVNGVLVEVAQQEKKARRRKGLERVQNLPGKLDHVSIVAYNVGNFSY